MCAIRTSGGPRPNAGNGGSNESDTSLDIERLAQLSGPDREGVDDLEIGDVFELLKNERRRRVIAFLKDQKDRTTTLDILAEHIAALENDIDVSQLSSSQRKRVYIALYQCHLPKMDNFGLIDYDKNRGTIELRDTTVVDPYLDGSSPEPTDDESDRTQLWVAATIAVIAVVGVSGFGALSVVPAAFWTVLTAVALLWVAAS